MQANLTSDATISAGAVGTLRFLDDSGWQAVSLYRASTSIGRSEDSDLVLSDHKVSRHHAVILREGFTYSVVDQNSTRGTFLNGQKVERSPLHNGDTLQFGSLSGIKLRFYEQADAPDTTENASLYQLLSVRQPRSDRIENPASAGQMEQLNWLLRAARQLNQGGAVNDILRVLLEHTLQLTGVERGFVFLCEAKKLNLAVGLNNAGETLADDGTISRSAIDRAIASDSSFSISDTIQDVAAQAWASVHINQIRSIYCIPLRTRAPGGHPQLLGLVYLDSRKTGATLSSIDHELLDAIATESASLVHNALMAAAEQEARRAQQELAVAARIHGSLMAAALPQVPFATLKARSVPCLAIGGDFYDAVAQPDAVSVVIVDVSGKGVSSAIVAATLQGVIHAQLLAGMELAAIAAMVNRFLCSRNVGKYATMVLLRLESDGRLEYLNCGHIAPLIAGPGGLRTLGETNLVVGLIAAATYDSTVDRLHPGERLLLVTDGITEAENPSGQAFGDSTFERILPGTHLEGVFEALAEFQGPQPAHDDCTLVEVQFR